MPPIHPPRQADHRLLVVYAIQGISRREYLDAQIQHYVALCESGFEVHLLLATGPGAQWEEYFRTSRLFCFRTQRGIPLSVINQDFASEAALPARHRRVFLHFNGSYDYYLNQEDDVIMKTHNFYYFLKWMDIFESEKGMNLLPGFVDIEVFFQRKKFANISRPVFEFFDTHVLLFNDEPLLIFRKTLQRLYILSQDKLSQFCIMEEWLGDLTRPYSEINVHMQARWLSRYVRFAIPLRDFYVALIHHSSDRYINWKSWDRKDNSFLQPHHNFAIHPAEFVELIRKLTYEDFRVNHHQQWSLQVHPSKNFRGCLESGKVLKIHEKGINFIGSFLAIDTNKSKVDIKKLSCACSVPGQDLEYCSRLAMKICHPTAYNDEERMQIPIILSCKSRNDSHVVTEFMSTSIESPAMSSSFFGYAFFISIILLLLLIAWRRCSILRR